MKLRELIKVMCVVKYDIVEVDVSGKFMNRYRFRYAGGLPHGSVELQAQVRLSTAKVLEVSTYGGAILEITVRTPA